MTELLVILVVALIVFGPTRLPELARSLGRAIHEFRRASSDLRASFNEAIEPAAPPAIAPPAAQGGPIDQPAAGAASAAAAGAPSPPSPTREPAPDDTAEHPPTASTNG